MKIAGCRLELSFGVAHGSGGPSGMPASKEILGDEEIWQIVDYIRHLPPKGNLASRMSIQNSSQFPVVCSQFYVLSYTERTMMGVLSFLLSIVRVSMNFPSGESS